MTNHQKTLAKNLVIWGASGHASVVADMVRLTDEFNIVGFLDDIDLTRKGSIFCGSTILGGSEQLEYLRKNNINHILLAFGDCQARVVLSSVVNQFGFELATVIHPNAVIGEAVSVGRGTVIMAGAVVNHGSIIQENVIINTSSSIDHGCIINNGVHIGPGVHLGGDVTIGQATWIGIGAIIKEKVIVGNNTIVGAGSVVLKDIPDEVVAFGAPARIIRNIEKKKMKDI